MKRKSRYLHRGATPEKRPGPLDLGTDDPRERIIRAARRLFAEHGYTATSIRDIASAADVNLSAISYYFTSKDLLYIHLLQAIVGPLSQRIAWATRGDAAPLVKIELVVRAFFEHIRLNPDMPAFMMRELSTGREPSGPIVSTMREILPAISGVIAQGQQIDEIRPGDPVLLTFSVIAQPIHLYLARGAIAAVARLDVNDPQVLDRIIEHVVVTVRRAMEPR